MAITPPDFTEANKKAMVISKITTAEFSCDESQSECRKFFQANKNITPMRVPQLRDNIKAGLVTRSI